MKYWFFAFCFQCFISSVFSQEIYRIMVNENFRDNQLAISQKSLEKKLLRGVKIDKTDYGIKPEVIAGISMIPQTKILGKSRWFSSVLVESYLPEDLLIQELFALLGVEGFQRLSTNSTPLQNEKLKLKHSATFKNKVLFTDDFYGESFFQNNLLEIPFLHREGFAGLGIDIGVFDSGFEITDTLAMFQTLIQERRILASFDFVENPPNIFRSHFHGTAVLSTMAGYIPGAYVGTAFASNYYLFRTEDVRSESILEEWNWTFAAEKADSLGLDIITASLAYSEFDDVSTSYTPAMMDGKTAIVSQAAKKAFDKGILVVNSAGNYGDRPWRIIAAPADAEGLIAVGALNTSGQLASFSSVGPSADGRIKPDCCAIGEGTKTAGFSNEIYALSGTSFSAPTVAGGLASLWSAFPSLSNQQMRKALLESATNATNPDNFCGYGVPNFRKAFENLASSTKADEQISVKANAVIQGDLLQVACKGACGNTFQLADMHGHLIDIKNFNPFFISIQTANLATGMYLLYSLDEENSFSPRKIIVVR